MTFLSIIIDFYDYFILLYEKKAESPHKSDGFYAKTPQRMTDLYLSDVILFYMTYDLLYNIAFNSSILKVLFIRIKNVNYSLMGFI